MVPTWQLGRSNQRSKPHSQPLPHQRQARHSYEDDDGSLTMRTPGLGLSICVLAAAKSMPKQQHSRHDAVSQPGWASGVRASRGNQRLASVGSQLLHPECPMKVEIWRCWMWRKVIAPWMPATTPCPLLVAHRAGRIKWVGGHWSASMPSLSTARLRTWGLSRLELTITIMACGKLLSRKQI